MSLGESASRIGKVRGLGPSGEGGEHWIRERIVSIAQLFLGLWLVASLLFLPSLDRATLSEWLARPSAAIPMLLFVVTAFWHGVDGLKVVVDDYVADEGNRFALNVAILFLAVAGASIAVFAILRIAFGGSA